MWRAQFEVTRATEAFGSLSRVLPISSSADLGQRTRQWVPKINLQVEERCGFKTETEAVYKKKNEVTGMINEGLKVPLLLT